MIKIKVGKKGKITLPKKILDSLQVCEGDTLLLEEKEGQIIVLKLKTIFDMAGTLPGINKPVEKMIEDSITEEYKENDKSTLDTKSF